MSNIKKYIVASIVIFTSLVIVYLIFTANDIKQYALSGNYEMAFNQKHSTYIIETKRFISNTLHVLLK